MFNPHRSLFTITLYCALALGLPACEVAGVAEVDEVDEVDDPGADAYSEEPSWGEGFAAPGAAPSEANGAGGPCYGTCNCKLGLYCSKSSGAQQGVCTNLVFSPAPTPPPSACYASCQCPYGRSCVFTGGSYGTCTAPGPGPCTSDCDCGVSHKCSAGQCISDFGPFPQCRCDKHCPNNGKCINGGCQ